MKFLNHDSLESVMVSKRKLEGISEAQLSAAQKRAKEAREKLKHKPSQADLLTPQEIADAAPFYFVLRNYIAQLREAREAAGLTLADISAKTGLAVESLSRLETGALTNPTWKTLAQYAVAVGRVPRFTAEEKTGTNGGD
jgi:ribosome-binding protein aMBF1 (putative translation factor)